MIEKMIEKITYECLGCSDICVITIPSYQEHPIICPCDMDYDTDWHEVTRSNKVTPLPESYLKE